MLQRFDFENLVANVDPIRLEVTLRVIDLCKDSMPHGEERQKR